jgi:hypothetical protein
MGSNPVGATNPRIIHDNREPAIRGTRLDRDLCLRLKVREPDMLQLFVLLAALQRTQSPVDEFRSIQAFRCESHGGTGHPFEPARPEENEERVVTSPPLLSDDHSVTFDSIDYRTLRARSVFKGTEERAVPVTVIPGDRLVSFLEVSPKGVPITTSILRTPRPANPRTPNSYFFVRSYQLLLSNEGDFARQMSGHCTALPTAGAPPNR